MLLSHVGLEVPRLVVLEDRSDAVEGDYVLLDAVCLRERSEKYNVKVVRSRDRLSQRAMNKVLKNSTSAHTTSESSYDKTPLFSSRFVKRRAACKINPECS